MEIYRAAKPYVKEFRALVDGNHQFGTKFLTCHEEYYFLSLTHVDESELECLLKGDHQCLREEWQEVNERIENLIAELSATLAKHTRQPLEELEEDIEDQPSEDSGTEKESESPSESSPEGDDEPESPSQSAHVLAANSVSPEEVKKADELISELSSARSKRSILPKAWNEPPSKRPMLFS